MRRSRRRSTGRTGPTACRSIVGGSLRTIWSPRRYCSSWSGDDQRRRRLLWCIRNRPSSVRDRRPDAVGGRDRCGGGHGERRSHADRETTLMGTPRYAETSFDAARVRRVQHRGRALLPVVISGVGTSPVVVARLSQHGDERQPVPDRRRPVDRGGRDVGAPTRCVENEDPPVLRRREEQPDEHPPSSASNRPQRSDRPSAEPQRRRRPAPSPLSGLRDRADGEVGPEASRPKAPPPRSRRSGSASTTATHPRWTRSTCIVAGRAGRPARSQRQRQDHAAADARRHARAVRGLGHGRRVPDRLARGPGRRPPTSATSRCSTTT